jgi:glucan phosphoethanolaminetransferase (alkaline phosphatase superfamily)
MKNAVLHLNWPMVLAAAVAYFAIGSIWYTVLFGKYWARVYHADTSNRSGMVRTMVIGFLLTFLITTVVGLILNAVRCKELYDCFIRAYILAAGLTVGLVGTALNYQRKPFGIWIVDIGYHLIGILVAALILAKWGMTSSAH